MPASGQIPSANPAVANNKGGSDNNNNSSSHTTTQTVKRLPKTTACLPIVYGSVAFYLGKKADEYQTHQWTLYVRGANNEDLSGVISKVVFQLHASFAQPVREILAPPFEVTERGWGEFEAQIRIIWKESSAEKSTLLTHGIKLYPPAAPGALPGTIVPPTGTETPVVAETYDECVFTDPTEVFYQQLLRISNLPVVNLKESRVQEAVGQFSDEQHFQALLEAKKFLEKELTSVRERFQQVEGENTQIDLSIRELQDKTRARKTQRGAAAASKKQKS